MKRLIVLMLVSVLLVACGSDDTETSVEETEQEENKEVDEEQQENEKVEEPPEITEQQQMANDILSLIDEELAFDSGTYKKGTIPKGEYMFVSYEGSGVYYSEVDSAGNIIDNENFDSFGYVHVHEAGNIENRGVLINVESLEYLDVNGAKDIFEKLNGIEDYHESGYYKVGLDIDPGEYALESYGSGYVALMSGPIGDSSIIQNDNFDGEYAISIEEGQYLILSRAYLVK